MTGLEIHSKEDSIVFITVFPKDYRFTIRLDSYALDDTGEPTDTRLIWQAVQLDKDAAQELIGHLTAWVGKE